MYFSRSLSISQSLPNGIITHITCQSLVKIYLYDYIFTVSLAECHRFDSYLSQPVIFFHSRPKVHWTFKVYLCLDKAKLVNIKIVFVYTTIQIWCHVLTVLNDGVYTEILTHDSWSLNITVNNIHNFIICATHPNHAQTFTKDFKYSTRAVFSPWILSQQSSLLLQYYHTTYIKQVIITWTTML